MNCDSLIHQAGLAFEAYRSTTSEPCEKMGTARFPGGGGPLVNASAHPARTAGADVFMARYDANLYCVDLGFSASGRHSDEMTFRRLRGRSTRFVKTRLRRRLEQNTDDSIRNGVPNEAARASLNQGSSGGLRARWIAKRDAGAVVAECVSAAE
jgi:hypothetical protein